MTEIETSADPDASGHHQRFRRRDSKTGSWRSCSAVTKLDMGECYDYEENRSSSHSPSRARRAR